MATLGASCSVWPGFTDTQNILTLEARWSADLTPDVEKEDQIHLEMSEGGLMVFSISWLRCSRAAILG